MIFQAFGKKISSILIVIQFLSLFSSSLAFALDDQNTPLSESSVNSATYGNQTIQATITSSTYSLPADGVSQTLITVQLLDQNGIPLSHDPGGLQLFASIGSLGNVNFQQAGSYHATLTSPDLSEKIRFQSDPESDVLIPLLAGTINLPQSDGSSIKMSMELTYETYGKYTAVLTSPTTPGTAIITATLNQTPFPTQGMVNFSPVIDPVLIEGISFGRNVYQLNAGETVQTALTARYSSGTTVHITSAASYTLQDPRIATITPDGLVKGISEGTTVLTAVYQNMTSSTEIRVAAPVTNNPNPSSGSGNGIGSPQQPPKHLIQIFDSSPSGRHVEISSQQLQDGIIKVNSAERNAEMKITALQQRQLLAENPSLQIRFQTAGASINVPLSEMKIGEFSRLLGIPESELTVSYTIAEAALAQQRDIQERAGSLHANLISKPVEFQINLYRGDDKVGSVTSFSPYISRTINLLTSNLSDTATGVRIDPGSGEFRFVPTRFEVVDGKKVAVLLTKELSNYVIIDHKTSFVDMQKHWAQEIVETMASKMIIQGKEQTVFDPDESISRAELAALLVRSLGLPDVETPSPFADIKGQWYESTINSAYRSGLINGYADGTFQAERTINREELVTMVLRALEYTKFVPQGDNTGVRGAFQDQAAFSDWAKAMILKASALGLVEGDTTGRFNPDGKASRAEAAAILYRMLRSIQFL
ncbi:S-layer homology domain-containing protein [Paenibacillus sp. HWE-109]|uniref:S-layer homology domain-containing protein n=1 Tax=Paenibacillus sp. HWE-109 TaxID=1306526 RepID=UPI001EDFE99D|nr:S-layer homology domain-containing protein [Paenibacillus sp. HWE-109]UKS26313.1 S-layer homology domain-containing protein [Paenibacillus sp. HWE-109]